jgi:predicted transcriptional regulator
MIDELKLLPPPEKKVAAKVLYKLGWGLTKIEEQLGVSDTSVWRYAQEPTPDDLKEFETEFETAIANVKQKGLALAQKRILELLPKERRIDQVVRAAEYLEGKSGKGDTKVQINNFIPILGGKTKE